jgi:hypothetical protein
MLSDDRIDGRIFVGGDDDGDNPLYVGEQWLYTASEHSEEGSNTNVATVVALAVDDSGNDLGLPILTDLDSAVCQWVIELTPDFAVCETFGDAQIIEFNYSPSSVVDTSQDASKAGILFDSGLVDTDGTSWIVVSDKEDGTDLGGKVYFNGSVDVGDDFLASAANAGTSKFGSGTFIHIYDDNPFNAAGDSAPDGGDDLLQSMEYHTSCSQPIFLGDQVGGVTLVGYQGEGGSWGI